MQGLVIKRGAVNFAQFAALGFNLHTEASPNARYELRLLPAKARIQMTQDQAMSGVSAPLGSIEHVCLMYRTQAEQLGAVGSWFRCAIERGERCVYIADDNSISEVRLMLDSQGIAVDTALEAGVMLVNTSSDPYIRRIGFEMNALFTYVDALCVDVMRRGSGGICLAREMTWTLVDRLSIQNFMESEDKLNRVPIPRLRLMCQFNVNRFGPDMFDEIVRLHPTVIVNGQVSSNPQYATA